MTPAQRDAPYAAIMDDYGYRILTAAALALLALGTVVYHLLEDWSWIDSLYFSSVAVSTVGFGDLVPTRDISKLFTILYIFTGIAIITSFLNVRLHRHAATVAERVRKRELSVFPEESDAGFGGGSSQGPMSSAGGDDEGTPNHGDRPES